MLQEGKLRIELITFNCTENQFIFDRFPIVDDIATLMFKVVVIILMRTSLFISGRSDTELMNFIEEFSGNKEVEKLMRKYRGDKGAF